MKGFTTKPALLEQRSAGLLLHVTSLPGPHGSGDLGPAAHRFVDFLAEAGQRWWQMLPVNPPAEGWSPYSPLSVFAGNPLLISLEQLADDGLLDDAELEPVRGLRSGRINGPAVARFRSARLRRAFENFREKRRPRAWQQFCSAQADWLDDYALFAALRDEHAGAPWYAWPPPLRKRHKAALRQARERLAEELEYYRFEQFVFAQQWSALKQYARERGVLFIGDLPIFCGAESCDVWTRPDLFQLYANGRPKRVTGVPPDAFSKTGQLWGHPQYDWPRHQRERFAWWIRRFRNILSLFDAIRVDHFLGFARVWSVPGKARTAKNGRWVATPGRKLFEQLERHLPAIPVIAEDLGILTDEAAQLRDDFGFPGMRLMQWGFDNDDAGARYHQPHRYPSKCVAYTGTHDNDTTVGWLRDLKRAARQAPKTRKDSTAWKRLQRYCNHADDICDELLRLGYLSSANIVIYPLQDILKRGSRARMNTPGTIKGNWEWRMEVDALKHDRARQLRILSATYERMQDND